MDNQPLIAILGGGQLGRMLGLAAIPLGFRCRFLDPSPHAGARQLGELIVGALDDPGALSAVAAGSVAVTYEWEGVPAESIEQLVREGHRVAPDQHALRASQHRGVEKAMFHSLGIATAPYVLVSTLDELRAAITSLGTAAILKTCTGGYDGKGQARIAGATESELDVSSSAAWTALTQGREAPYDFVLEGVVPFDRELSVLAARADDGTTVVYDLVHNTHVNGILSTSFAPAADCGPTLQQQANAIAIRVLDHLQYVGLIAIELFQVGDELVANEFAPRVHNSGHHTIEGAATSQFENHIRAIAALPLGDPSLRGYCAMMNAVGALPSRAAVLGLAGAHFHDYAKAPRAGRKVGHVNLFAANEPERAVLVKAYEAAVRSDR